MHLCIVVVACIKEIKANFAKQRCFLGDIHFTHVCRLSISKSKANYLKLIFEFIIPKYIRMF